MIESIALANFKAFDDIELPLGNLTLLSGLNGTGKSSVLQALALLRQSFESGILQQGEIALNGSLVEIGTGRDVLFQDFDRRQMSLALGIKVDHGVQYLEWTTDVDVRADVLVAHERPQDLLTETASLFKHGFQFLRADRITPSVTFPRSQHAVGHEHFLGARGEYTAHFLLRFRDLVVDEHRRHGAEVKAAGLLAHVNAWMQEFSPGVRLEPDELAMTDYVRLAYAYKGEGVSYSEPMRPTNVGFGLTHVLPVLTACLAAPIGAMIIIENPEAQLHPRGQAALGRLMALTAASGVQVIVETHSDHVLNGVRLAVKGKDLAPTDVKIHFFKRERGHATDYESPAIDITGRLSFWPNGFFDQWERSLDELLS